MHSWKKHTLLILYFHKAIVHFLSKQFNYQILHILHRVDKDWTFLWTEIMDGHTFWINYLFNFQILSSLIEIAFDQIINILWLCKLLLFIFREYFHEVFILLIPCVCLGWPFFIEHHGLYLFLVLLLFEPSN